MNSKFILIKDFNAPANIVRKGTVLKVIDQDRHYVYLGNKDYLASLTYEEIEEFTKEIKSEHTLEGSVELLNEMILESNEISKIMKCDNNALEESLKEIVEYIKP